ncbi:MAG: ClpXP protease specificity-enhancing factor [Sulfuritalea sp.]|nr:ClpXP protease specificity-enhancing factor [Sulfuritalea sp.]
MVSTKPYLLRAIYQWCVDQGFTPYLSVVADARTRVPREYVRDGRIVLNLGSEATHQLQMADGEISFQARFNGVAFPIVVPVAAVAAIYARENGQGISFEVSEAPDDREEMQDAGPAEADPGKPVQPPASRSHLTRVK